MGVRVCHVGHKGRCSLAPHCSEARPSNHRPYKNRNSVIVLTMICIACMYIDICQAAALPLTKYHNNVCLIY